MTEDWKMLKYEEPKIEILVFESHDIMNASGDQTGGWDGPGDPIETPSVGI